MRRYKLILFLITFVTMAFAQEEQAVDNYSVLSSDTLSSDVGLIPESLDADVDSLLKTWHVRYFTKRNEYCHDDDDNVYFPDSIYMQRLEQLPRVINLPYNNVVRDCIDLYAERRRGLVKYMLGMADFYFPIIEKILDEHGLPIELKYLAVVESALNPVALSRVGACGLWQFMLPTGKMYGLEINSLIDERRDPEKATHAACAYFKDMYEIYKDWNLVLAAYNCGPGNVNKAIRRSGGKTDFWQIFPYLPKETRSYVPLFIAANYIMNYYCDHNICPIETDLPMATDTVMINKPLHFQQVSDMLGLEIEQLRALNPQYKRDIIPGNTKISALKLPAAQTYAFVDKEDTVYTHRAEDLLANCLPYSSQPSYGATKEKITHKVLSGENLYTIANRYGVTAQDLKKWNNLSSTRVAKGKLITLFVDNGGVAFALAKKADQENVSQNSVKNSVQGPDVKKTVSTTTTTTTSSSSSSSLSGKAASSATGGISYKVKSGDSLYSIAKRYPGISISDLQKANGLRDASIRPGQILKIPVSKS